MAQVKLQFRAINDRQHVATRSMQLTVKKTSRSQKTLDCSLVVVNNGERTTTSTRQAQLDEMIPERLGVSPAILDAVIFCHQDESLWPLSEPAALKKRFDEIFEALKYTKAIENLKVLRKKQVEQLGKLQTDESHNKINKDRGERAEKRMSALQAEIEDARGKCEELTADMEETQEKIRGKHEQANSYLQIVQNLNNKREQLDYRQGATDELRQTIDELPDDDLSLEASLVHYEDRMLQCQEEAEKNKTQYTDLQKDLNQARKSLSNKLSEQGKHASDRDKYERQLVSRTDMIHEAARTYSLRGFDGTMDEQTVKSFHDKIQRLLIERRRDLERLQKDNAVELDKETGSITELEGRKAARTQDRISAKQRLVAIEKRMGILQTDMSSIDADEGAKAILDGQLSELDGSLGHAKQQYEKSEWDRQLAEEGDKLRQQETENEQLGRELVECTRLASERAQIDYRKKELADRQRKLETLTATWKSKLSSVLGENDWQPDALDTRFREAMDQQSKNLRDARNRHEQTQKKQQGVEYRLKDIRQSHENRLEESTRCKQKVTDVLQTVRAGAIFEDYAEEVASVEQQVEELRNEVSLFDALVEYYSKCRRMLDTQRKCLLCETHFDDSQHAKVERLSNKITRRLDPEAKSATETDLKEWSGALERLRSVRSAHETHDRVSAELPLLWEACKAVEAEKDGLDRRLDEEEALVRAEEERFRDLEDVSKTVMSISQTVKDIRDSKGQLDRVMTQVSKIVASRSAEELHELQAGLSEQMRFTKNRLSKFAADKQRMKDQITSLELEKSGLQNRISRAAAQLEKLADLQMQMQSLREEQAHQRDAIHQVDEELEKIEPEIAGARSIRDETLQKGRDREKAATDARDAIATTVSELKLVDKDIEDYLDRGGPASLASNQREIAALEKSISATEQEVADLTVRANKLKQDIDNGDRKKKNVSDNLNYRRHLRTLSVLRREIEELEDRNAQEDYERLHDEARMLENQANRLFAERGSVMGMMKSKDEELDRLLKEWEVDFKDAKQRYRESHIRVETTKAAIEDLAQCSAAVDKAVMQFHSMKMAEVNRIAGELWQSTYQGTDIDTILIRSDNESSTGRRSYNYRLCMVKQDTEMDMRGRCSAGQKVLASIIIRLALAESFGVNCGLIALDEPTTNLDRDNIKSLAESLHGIIRARQAQRNFQLIVITHDEEFLRHMRCGDFCDSFFRVKRDERQNSVISRESITRIF